ncbi:hypothetical protein QYE76_063205 [Lolium multiflorum]|uniref:Uncharacterized protein n=1 Tax=Lolium multiflorum TaxID=4521 RepID=A0AAD8S586_LOLMU|nr:hypothetical protein QYE76_063205 [Lolium multiflorum]
MLGLARNDSSQACAQSNALKKIKQSVTQKLPLSAAAPCSVSVFFCLCHGMRPTAHGKRKSRGCVLCGQARGHESSGAHGKRVKPPLLGCSRQVLALIKGVDACQAKKAQAWTSTAGQLLALLLQDE